MKTAVSLTLFVNTILVGRKSEEFPKSAAIFMYKLVERDTS
jgi:hypothetical protein